MDTNLILEIDNSRKISAIRAIKNFTIENQMYEYASEFRRIERDIIIENNRNGKIGNLSFINDLDKSIPFIDDIDQYLYSISIIQNMSNKKDKIKIIGFLDKIRIELRDEKINELLK